MNKLPVFEMVIDENAESDVEVSAIAFVDKPAIEKNFIAFKAQTLHFAIDTQRQIVSGPAMVPDTLIYRKDQTGEYNVFFSKDTIEKIALKFFKKDYQKNLNLFHDPALALPGVTIFESFISDKSRGIPPMKGFEDTPDGTWFISAKVENPEVWAQIQSGVVKGFSVEGIFSYMKPKTMEDAVYEAISATMGDNVHLKEKDFMSKVKELVAQFKKTFFDGTPLVAPVVTPAPIVTPAAPNAGFTDYTLKDGTVASIDKLEVGGVIMMNGVPCPAGEYELQDGSKVTVGDGGVITLVTPGVGAPAMDPALTMAQVEMAINKALSQFKEKMEAEAKLAKEAMEQKLSASETTVQNQNKTIKQLFEIIEQIAAMEPEAAPAKPSKSAFFKNQESEDERVKRIAANLKKVQKEFN